MRQRLTNRLQPQHSTGRPFSPSNPRLTLFRWLCPWWWQGPVLPHNPPYIAHNQDHMRILSIHLSPALSRLLTASQLLPKQAFTSFFHQPWKIYWEHRMASCYYSTGVYQDSRQIASLPFMLPALVDIPCPFPSWPPHPSSFALSWLFASQPALLISKLSPRHRLLRLSHPLFLDSFSILSSSRTAYASQELR